MPSGVSADKDKTVLLFLGLGTLSLALGEVSWAYYEVFLGLDEPPYPSIADYFYLASYPFLFISLLSMSRFSGAGVLTRVRAVLDITVVTILAFVPMWFFLIKPVYTPEAPLTEAIVNGLYPALDVALIIAILINLMGFKRSKWRAWEIMIAAGFVLTIAADVIFNYFAGQNVYFAASITARLLDLLWMASYFLFFLAALFSIKSTAQMGAIDSETQVHVGWRDSLIPLTIAIAIPLFIYEAQFRVQSVYDSWALIVSATALAVAVAIRASVVVVENNRLFSSATTDALTGQYNHRFFQERLKIELDRAERSSESLSMAIIDVDDFSRINNVYGHFKGDVLLHEMGAKIKEHVRTTDTVARIGGDEFGLILPDTAELEAYKVCMAAQEAVNSIHGFEELGVTISAGIATFPEHAEDLDTLTKKADGALYWAKYHGKSQVLIYDPATIETLDVEERIQRIEDLSYLSTVQSLAAAVDARDPYTRHHSQHVSGLVNMMSQKVGFDKEKAKMMETAALLHDVGKIGIPDSILQKPGKLTDQEMEKIREHPQISQKILSASTFEETLPWIVAHHERWDGKGYPEGLKGEEIPLEARILAICDSYEAMTSDRPYRGGLPREKVVDELRDNSGTQFDPGLVEMFIEFINRPKKKRAA